MSTIKTFQDLAVWQKARLYAHEIFRLTERQGFNKDYSLKDQINRAAGGVMDNIAEGFDRDGNREFLHFLSIAKGCLSETQSQLFRALDRKYIIDGEFSELQNKAREIGKMIGGLMKYLKESEFKGSKFKEPTPDFLVSTESAGLPHQDMEPGIRNKEWEIRNQE
jgi:four helix bundle protein